MSRRREEDHLQRAALAHIRLRGVRNLFCCHVPLGGTRSPVEAAIMVGLGVVVGMPDLLLIHAGQVFGLELKTATGKLSTAQIATQEAMRAAGCTVATVHSIDEAIRVLEGWHLLRGRADLRGAA
jgi:hypothetical protein